MGADTAVGGVLRRDIRPALTHLLRGTVLQDRTRDPLLPDTQGTLVIDAAIVHTHPKADTIDVTPRVTPRAVNHVADLPRLVDTDRTLADHTLAGRTLVDRTLADRGAPVNILVAAAGV